MAAAAIAEHRSGSDLEVLRLAPRPGEDAVAADHAAALALPLLPLEDGPGFGGNAHLLPNRFPVRPEIIVVIYDERQRNVKEAANTIPRD